ncbi:MAG: peptidylprolyl isomerase FKBP-type [Crocinitomicaceae bacterium]|jgi:FKBP-type peptidyl-prolyl cis-trans isomerase|nr:peptidylprolyl isomerase FKBP-type [Crocinitomicaceae bacterium]
MFRKIAWISLLLASCTSAPPEEKPKDVDWSTKKSTDMNQDFAIEEDLRIKMFLADRPDWKTVKTGSGLRYYIYKPGPGPQAESGMRARVKYRIELLDGTLCYETEKNETEVFEIDNSEVETGVQEGIKKMKVGDKAKLILPSHIAHGLTGDMDQIPPLSTIVIDLELISLEK